MTIVTAKETCSKGVSTLLWSGRFLAVTVILVLFPALSVWAQRPVDAVGGSYESRRAQESARVSAEVQARQRTEQLFERLCPGRCELVAVNVEMSTPKLLGTAVPGFESIAPSTGYRAKPQSVQLTVLLDRKLPASFKQNVPRMLEYRLQGLAARIGVRTELLNFPEPQLPPLPPPFPENAQGLMPQAQRFSSSPDVSPENVVAPEELTNEVLFLKALAPWSGPVVLLLLGLMGAWLLLRQRRGEKGDKPELAMAMSGATKAGSTLKIDWPSLEGELASSRAVRNAMLRRWLEDDEEAVGKLVELMGASLLDDLRKERRWQGAIARIADQVAQAEGDLHYGALEATALGHSLKSRLIAAQLTSGTDAMAREWDFLEGISLSALKRLLRRCDPQELNFTLARAPEAVRASYLEVSSDTERQDLLMAVGRSTLTRSEAMNLAQRLRRIQQDTIDATLEQGGEAGVVVQMLESLPAEEQQAVLSNLLHRQPQVAQSVLSRLVLEATFLHMPEEILLDTMHRLPTEALVPYLSGVDSQLREHLLSVIAENRRSTLEGEISLAGHPTRSEHLLARRRFTDTLKSSLEHEGHDLYEVNVSALEDSDGAGIDAWERTDA